MGVSLEESVAEYSCTAAGLLVAPPPSFYTTTITTVGTAAHSYPPASSPRGALAVPVARQLPPRSLIGRWHGSVPLPDPASCTDCRRRLVFHADPSPLPAAIARQHRHPCLRGIWLARAGWPKPAGPGFCESGAATMGSTNYFFF